MHLFVNYNTATCFSPFMGPSSGCEMNAFQKGKYAFEVYTSFFVRSYILQKFSCCILLCHLVAVVCK